MPWAHIQYVSLNLHLEAEAPLEANAPYCILSRSAPALSIHHTRTPPIAQVQKLKCPGSGAIGPIGIVA